MNNSFYTFASRTLSVGALASLWLALPTAHAGDTLDEIVVTAELLENNALQLPNSVSVVTQQDIEARSARHLEDLLNLAPNVNYASGASRGRFIQIRGIGERSEFQEPLINSVGVLVDGIDLTGIATAATTLDVQQVEILRGPQGTLFGANALAGMINVVSNNPGNQFAGGISTALEDFGGVAISGFVNAPTNDTAAVRLAVQHYSSDGFTDNAFLGRDDTNNIDETTARMRYRNQLGDALELDVALLMADVDNGYDAFSLDNTRTTYSDEPGIDTQQTVAGSFKLAYQLASGARLQGLLSLADSELEYSYDEDWGNDDICANTACDSSLWGFDWFYSSFDQYRRDNRNTSLDINLRSAPAAQFNWLLGVYHRDQSIDLQRDYTFADDFASALDTRNSAVYGQLDMQLDDAWQLSAGLRFERRDVDYSDVTGANANPDENLWGGRLALEYLADSGAFYYALVSRGYKAGGFNLDGSISAAQREFDTETMLNYELGFKHSLLADTLQLQLALFYQDRDNIQSKQSIVRSVATGVEGGLCPCSFTDFTDNATSGSNIGLELELNWLATERLTLFATLGLLDSKFDEFLTFEHINADRDNGVPFDLQGREQAHAPSWQWTLGGRLQIASSWYVSGSIEAKDGFFFSERHDERADAYELLNLELGYQADNWSAAIYAKNLTDELVKTRGFGSFGNDPRKFYELEPYNQFAAPRLLGVKASISF